MKSEPPTTDTPAVVPDRLFHDPTAEARWRARFRAAQISLPVWATDAPEANLYRSNETGVWEIYAWDRARGTRRQVTDRRAGTAYARLSPDGAWIWWFDDTDGDEFGSWVREPFGGGVPAQAVLPGVRAGNPAGLEIGRQLVAVGVSTDLGSELYTRAEGHTARFYHSRDDAGVVALSRDERLIAIRHSEHGDSRYPALRVLTTADFAVVADKWDGVGKELSALGFAPVQGDPRLLLRHERRGRGELLIWDVATDTESEIGLDLPGEVSASWCPDAAALLVLHTRHGRGSLYRYELTTGESSRLETPPGWIDEARARHDGVVEYSWSSAAKPPVVRTREIDGTCHVLLNPSGDSAPESVPVTDVFVNGVEGPIHVFVSRPTEAPDGPLPTVFALHGGPHYADADRFSASDAAWVDAGFAVVKVNYRGSTEYGAAWRDAIAGRPGFTELEDVAAVHDWAIASGLADRARSVIAGPSWAGYLTLLALGTQPRRWAAGVAAVPLADYVTAYQDETEQLRSFDRALLGGSPDTVLEAYQRSSPITYVAAVNAPVLVLAGNNDPRCPIRQVENYVERLAECGARYEFYRYDAGHDTLVTGEQIRQIAIEIHFTMRVLGLH